MLLQALQKSIVWRELEKKTIIASCDKTDDAQEDVTMPISTYLGKLLVCKVERNECKNRQYDAML